MLLRGIPLHLAFCGWCHTMESPSPLLVSSWPHTSHSNVVPHISLSQIVSYQHMYSHERHVFRRLTHGSWAGSEFQHTNRSVFVLTTHLTRYHQFLGPLYLRAWVDVLEPHALKPLRGLDILAVHDLRNSFPECVYERLGSHCCRSCWLGYKM